MKVDEYDRVVVTENEALCALYEHGTLNFDNFFLEDFNLISQYNSAVNNNADDFEQLSAPGPLSVSIFEFDKLNQKTWFYPSTYAQFDIVAWLYAQCNTETETERVSAELVLFEKYKLQNLLIYLKFLVDTMRENNILWGVGRGSSVCSFVLYLIGVSKINPMTYGLDIHEFLK